MGKVKLCIFCVVGFVVSFALGVLYGKDVVISEKESLELNKTVSGVSINDMYGAENLNLEKTVSNVSINEAEIE